MQSKIKNIINSLNKTKTYLILANILLVFFAILLTNVGILPFKRISDFAFFAVIGLIFALYRPGWAFLFFVGTIALENINVAPKGFFIEIRPYQFFGAAAIIAIAIRYFSKRLNFKLVKLRWFDYLLIFFAIASFFSSLFSVERGASFKQSLVLLSFVFLYFLVRNYIQKPEDLKKVLPFFLSSSAVIIFYGIWQNWRFVHRLNSFEVMLGRPNATFTEADWLGIFLVFLIAVIYSIIYYLNKPEDNQRPVIFNFQFFPLRRDPAKAVAIFNQFTITKFKILKFFLYIILVACYILLILTVSRSAWLGAGIVTIIFLKLILTDAKFNPKYWQWRQLSKAFLSLIIAGVVGIGIIYIFHLTNFQLFNRAQSSASGLQKITIACNTNIKLPDSINNVQELNQYNCRHINLEDIEKEKSEGNIIKEIYRPDPNVGIRSQVYQKSWNEIKKHPIMGIGWGSIGKVLGTDERGVSLNSSNIFLEVWLGSGILGLLDFLVILGYILAKSLRGIFSDDFEKKTISTLIILMFFALIIPNLFNAGIFLGILWLFLGIAVV